MKASAMKKASRNKAPQLFLCAEDDSDDKEVRKVEKYDKLENYPGSNTLFVYVSSICNPECFYVQRGGSKSVELDKVVHEMSNFYDNDVNRKMNSLSEVRKKISYNRINCVCV